MKVITFAAVLLAFLHFADSFGLRYVYNETADVESHLMKIVDFSEMTVSEQNFAYFKIHDADNNDKLDGCEMAQSMYDFHDARTKMHVSDEQLEMYLDPVLKISDRNSDGFIDYEEYTMFQSKKL